MTFLPNMSHRAFVTFSYAAFLETEHLRSSLTFFRWDFSLNCKKILTRNEVYCQQHSFILYPIPQSRWQRYIFDSLLSFWFSYLPSFVKYVKQKDAKVYCFNGRSNSWKIIVLLVWFKTNWNFPLILIPCNFWVMKRNFLPKKHLRKIRESPKLPRQKSHRCALLGGRQNLDDFRGFSMRRSDPMVTKGGPGRRERAPRRESPVEGGWASA